MPVDQPALNVGAAARRVGGDGNPGGMRSARPANDSSVPCRDSDSRRGSAPEYLGCPRRLSASRLVHRCVRYRLFRFIRTILVVRDTRTRPRGVRATSAPPPLLPSPPLGNPAARSAVYSPEPVACVPRFSSSFPASSSLRRTREKDPGYCGHRPRRSHSRRRSWHALQGKGSLFS